MDHLATMLFGLSIMAGSTASGVVPIPGVIETAMGGAGLITRLSRRRRTDAERVLTDFQKTLDAEWRSWGESSSEGDSESKASAAASFREIARKITLTPAEVVGGHLDPQAVAHAILAKAAELHPAIYADEDPQNADAHLARTFLLRVTESAYAHLLSKPGFIDRLVPALLRNSA